MTAVGSEDAEVVPPTPTAVITERISGSANVTVAQRIARRYGPGDVLAATTTSITVSSHWLRCVRGLPLHVPSVLVRV